MLHILDDFTSFLDNSPTSWHAAREIGNRLAILDFIPLSEDEVWHLEAGKKYFVSRGGSICAFCLPTSKPTGATILASHTDSPALKLKPMPEFQKENMTQFGVEIYGGPLLTSWLNRDLGIAGRVIVADAKDNILEKLVFIDDSPVIIPQLAIHLDREVNEKGLILNKQDHLSPLVTLGNDPAKKTHLENLIRGHFPFKTLLSFDLFLAPLEPARYIGSKGEMIASSHLDNLASAHACTTALATARQPHENKIQMAIFWDNEEIGSRTSEGAASPFLNDVLKRISIALNISEEERIRMTRQSLCVSIDMSHAMNPNYANKSEPNHSSLLGKGIVIKYNADQKYATNAMTASVIVRAAQQLNIGYQSYVSRTDMSSGSTVGPIVATILGMETVDIGCSLLSMHSVREVMSCQDHLDMCQLLTYLLEQS